MKFGSRQISSCRLCRENSFHDILDLGEQYFTGRFIKPNEENPPKARLGIAICDSCGLVQLMDSYPAAEMYGPNYGYRSSITDTMRAHLEQIAIQAVSYCRVGEKAKVLDIGSNDGTLLNYFAGSCSDLTGIDPCAEKHLDNYDKRIRVITDYFSAENLRRDDKYPRFDIITSIAMFYDIETPVEFASQIRSMLSSDGIWITEQTHSHTLLNSNCYDSICHEHVTYLSMNAMELICEKAGLKILSVSTNNINGGSFRLTISKNNSLYTPDSESIRRFKVKEAKLKLRDLSTWRAFSAGVLKHKESLEIYLNDETRKGKKILGYGASTKGNVLLQFCNISIDIMPFILERDPRKYGLITPGTRIPVISEEEGKNLAPDILVVFPWHFKDEIIRRETNFLANGGTLVFPLPELKVMTAES